VWPAIRATLSLSRARTICSRSVAKLIAQAGSSVLGLTLTSTSPWDASRSRGHRGQSTEPVAGTRSDHRGVAGKHRQHRSGHDRRPLAQRLYTLIDSDVDEVKERLWQS